MPPALDWTHKNHYVTGNKNGSCGVGLEIRFGTRKLKRGFDNMRECVRRYGDRVARAIVLRMAVLKGANHLGLVHVDRPIRRHQLSGKRKDQFAVDLVHPHRLVFRPDHNPIPRKLDEGIDLMAVTAIEIIEVIDYH